MTEFMLDNFIIDHYIESALKEDMFYGDITTDSICLNLDNPHFKVDFKARESGILAGRKVFERIFEILANTQVKVNFLLKDGDSFKKDDIIATVEGDANLILKGERLALNFVQKMSGIATYTRMFADKLSDFDCKIADTRKNTPNFRLFEKYSVFIGSKFLHRFNLSDAVMLKDNHIALFNGSITNAVREVRKSLSHTHKIEVECDTIEQVKEALENNVDIIMLDNMSVDLMQECVKFINKRAIVEASGNVNIDNLENIAKTGVDVISTSALIMRARALDLAFDYAK